MTTTVTPLKAVPTVRKSSSTPTPRMTVVSTGRSAPTTPHLYVPSPTSIHGTKLPMPLTVMSSHSRQYTPSPTAIFVPSTRKCHSPDGTAFAPSTTCRTTTFDRGLHSSLTSVGGLSNTTYPSVVRVPVGATVGVAVHGVGTT